MSRGVGDLAVEGGGAELDGQGIEDLFELPYGFVDEEAVLEGVHGRADLAFGGAWARDGFSLMWRLARLFETALEGKGRRKRDQAIFLAAA